MPINLTCTVSVTALVFCPLIVLGFTSTAAAGPAMTCMDRPVTIAGTEASDVVTGTAGADVIASMGGDDTVLGLGGDDVVCAGSGADVVVGGTGVNSLNGEQGDAGAPVRTTCPEGAART
jgi:Ca2+-binding RTX toxin-like protein